MGEPKIGQCMELPEISPVPDWCHTSPSITNSELCEHEKKNSPLLKTLVPRPISCGSGSGTLTSEWVGGYWVMFSDFGDSYRIYRACELVCQALEISILSIEDLAKVYFVRI